MEKLEIIKPGEIEAKSMEIIKTEMEPNNYTQEQLPIVKRCIHTSADFDYGKNLVFTPGAVAAGVAAIRKGCTIVTDTQMAKAGINKKVLESFGGQAICFMSDPDVAQEAKSRGITRAVVSMERAAKLSGTVILALGNAPTALIRACELVADGTFSPELIIGVPVGFVNVVESKDILELTPGEHIVSRGRKGGSNIAAAICNALIYMASGNRRE